MFKEMEGKRAAELYDIDDDGAELLIGLLERSADMPIEACPVPVLMAQGALDFMVFTPATDLTAKQLETAGTVIDYRTYAEANHDSVLADATPDILPGRPNSPIEVPVGCW